MVAVAGCVGPALPAGESGPTTGPEATTPTTGPTNEPEAATATAGPTTGPGDSRAAHFLFNNHADESYALAVFLVQPRGESASDFPVAVTLRNGTTRTYWTYDDVPPSVLGAVTRIEPANGTVLAVRQPLPARSTVHLEVSDPPANVTLFRVAYRSGDPPGVKAVGYYGSTCLAPQAHVSNFTANSTAGASCGDRSDVAFPDSTTRHVATVNDESETTGERTSLRRYI